jgi:hypothetical protein
MVKKEEPGVRELKAIVDAVKLRESLISQCHAFEAEHDEILSAHKALLEARESSEMDIKTLTAQYSVATGMKHGEILPGYSFVYPRMRRVDVAKLLKLQPDFAKKHSDLLDVDYKQLNALVDMGEMDAKVRNDVVVEEFGSLRCSLKKERDI